MQTYIKLVCLLGISGSLIVASPVERQQTTCQPDFEYDYSQTGGISKKVSALVRFISHSRSTWGNDGAVVTPVYADVDNCATPGQGAAASWVQYMSKTLQTHTKVNLGGEKRCMTFRMNSGDGIWSFQQPIGVYSIESYKTYNRLYNGQSVYLGSNIGWEVSGTSLIWNTFAFNKKPTQLWQVQCQRCNLAADAVLQSSPFVARNCTLISKDPSSAQCILAGQNGALTVGPCPADPTTDASGLWHIVLVDANDAAQYQYTTDGTANIME